MPELISQLFRNRDADRGMAAGAPDIVPAQREQRCRITQLGLQLIRVIRVRQLERRIQPALPFHQVTPDPPKLPYREHEASGQIGASGPDQASHGPAQIRLFYVEPTQRGGSLWSLKSPPQRVCPIQKMPRVRHAHGCLIGRGIEFL